MAYIPKTHHCQSPSTNLVHMGQQKVQIGQHEIISHPKLYQIIFCDMLRFLRNKTATYVFWQFASIFLSHNLLFLQPQQQLWGTSYLKSREKRTVFNLELWHEWGRLLTPHSSPPQNAGHSHIITISHLN